MAINYINLHIAKSTLILQNTNGFHSSISTIWKGSHILVVWNNIANSILQIWPEDVVEEEDMLTLHEIIIGSFVGIM